MFSVPSSAASTCWRNIPAMTSATSAITATTMTTAVLPPARETSTPSAARLTRDIAKSSMGNLVGEVGSPYVVRAAAHR
jgi:hypothetical protein